MGGYKNALSISMTINFVNNKYDVIATVLKWNFLTLCQNFQTFPHFFQKGVEGYFLNLVQQSMYVYPRN